MKKHFFFDMDGTLTPSRSKMEAEMQRAFGELASFTDVVVVSGAAKNQIVSQMPNDSYGDYWVLAQNGNAAFSRKLTPLWENVIPWDLKYWIFRWIHNSLYYNCECKEWTAWPMPTEDLVEDRGCQVSYSMIGHHAPAEQKRAFDPDGRKRRQMLVDLPWTERRIDVVIGGTTCLDFFLAGRNKGANVARLADEMGWRRDECVYVGDQLYEGGNDNSVLGAMPVIETRDTKETLEIINKLLQEI